MNILDYIEKFGSQTFEQRPFNNVDATIMATLSYVNFDLYSQKEDGYSIILKDLEPSSFARLCEGEFITKPNIDLLTKLKSSPRYYNIAIKFVRSEHSIVKEEQFFAITLVLPNNEFFIAFRGTDLTLLGWKEDTNMAMFKTVPSQHRAVNYVNEVASKLKGNFYIGGHSKGGNLAFYAHLNMDEKYSKRLIHSYSLDGPGFFDLDGMVNDHIVDETHKMIKLVPQNTIVGIMLSNLKDAKVVYSTYAGIFQHNPYSWQVNQKTKDFIYRKRRTSESYINELALTMWLNSLTLEERVFAGNAIFELLGGTKLNLTAFIKQPIERIKTIYEVQKKASKDDKQKFISIFKQLLYYHRRAKEIYRLEAKQEKMKEEN